MRKREFYAIGFSVLIFFDTLTHVAIKLSSAHAGAFAINMEWIFHVMQNPWLYAAIVGYLGAFVSWMTLLKQAPIGPAFAASHLGMVAVLAVSVGIFGEHLSALQLVGASCIVIGIIFLGISETRQPHVP